jgi:hypothetical protein
VNLFSIKNLIQLSRLQLHAFVNLFSCQDLRDYVFQDSIVKVICLGKCFKMLIDRKSSIQLIKQMRVKVNKSCT